MTNVLLFRLEPSPCCASSQPVAAAGHVSSVFPTIAMSPVSSAANRSVSGRSAKAGGVSASPPTMTASRMNRLRETITRQHQV